MISISLSTAIVLYSALLGLLILLIWLYTEVSVRRSHTLFEKQFLWRCVFCGYVYLDEAAETLSQCPRCHSFSSVEDKHARFIRARVSRPQTAEASSDLPGVKRRDTSHRKRPHQRRRGPRKH
jgi:hypothetical protein